jgi:hypothetical protein
MSRVQMNPDFERLLADALRPKMSRLAKKIAATGRRRCPVDTGELQRSIVPTIEDDSTIVVRAGNSRVRYALFVHDGYTHTSGRWIAGRPFLTNALYEEAARELSASD